MPRFEPFRATRYAPGTDPGAVTAPPYDVIKRKKVEALARQHHNIVQVDVPRITVDTDDPYGGAAQIWRSWLQQGVLVTEDQPSFTIYRMRFTDDLGRLRDLAAVIGAAEVVDEGAGGVLPHERTTPKDSTDRLDLTRATRANLSPVWGLTLTHGLTDLLREPGEPLGSMVDLAGVEHVVERLTDPDRVAAIRALVSSDDILIADGHHRYGVARHYRDEVRAETGRRDTSAELTLMYVGELVPDQLSIRAIHRLYRGVDASTLRDRLTGFFEVAPGPQPSPELLRLMDDRGALALVGPDGRTELLTPRPGAFDGIRALDGAWLEAALADLPHQVHYEHDPAHAVEEVLRGHDDAAVLIRPTSIDEIERTAREGALMPPKSTFFTPKIRTGFVMRSMA